MIKYAELKQSTREEKKYMMIFYDENKNKIKTVHFGAFGMNDFIKTGDEDAKNRYLKRHKKNENWDKFDTAGSLSRWILWNKKTLKSSYDDYITKFKLKKMLY